MEPSNSRNISVILSHLYIGLTESCLLAALRHAILEQLEMCGCLFWSEKSLSAPGGINCHVSGIDRPPFQPSTPTL